MLRIDCPYCGPRPESEFRYGGEAERERPEFEAPIEDWARYLYSPANPKGPHRERWLHAHGCGAWFIVTRDTATHAISSTEAWPTRNRGKARG